MQELTTGQVAKAAGLSERAVRLYADCGLLAARRLGADGRRMLQASQVDRARTIRLLRGLALSLSEIDSVLSDADVVSRFDEIWSARRLASAESAATSEYVRSVLRGESRSSVVVKYRDVAEQLVLSAERSPTLRDIAQMLPETTEILFNAITSANVDLVGPPFVTYHERATDGFAGRVTVAVPIGALLRPPLGLSVAVYPAHKEAYVSLSGIESRRQDLLVTIHDYLAAGRFAEGVIVVGDNRETYLPTWGDEGASAVMEIAVPVEMRAGSMSESI